MNDCNGHVAHCMNNGSRVSDQDQCGSNPMETRRTVKRWCFGQRPRCPNDDESCCRSVRFVSSGCSDVVVSQTVIRFWRRALVTEETVEWTLTPAESDVVSDELFPILRRAIFRGSMPEFSSCWADVECRWESEGPGGIEHHRGLRSTICQLLLAAASLKVPAKGVPVGPTGRSTLGFHRPRRCRIGSTPSPNQYASSTCG